MNTPTDEPAEAGTLADVRRAAGLTQRRLGQRLRLTQTGIGRIEERWPNVRLSTLSMIVGACDAQLRIEATVNGKTIQLWPTPPVADLVTVEDDMTSDTNDPATG